MEEVLQGNGKMRLGRSIRHLFTGPWKTKQLFPAQSMKRIKEAVAESERAHSGELVFAVEAALGLLDLLKGTSVYQRALDVFSKLRVWDTEFNNGVMIYLLLAERRAQIIADRGIHQHVGDEGWQKICREMETEFAAGRFEQGVIKGITLITEQLKSHFPAEMKDENEIPDEPVVL